MKIDSIPLAASLALGGLGIFLIAVKLMSNSLKTMSGGYTVKLMKKFSANRWLSLAFGVGFTTMIQSSDGAVALAIGLIAAGFMDLGAAIPFILGANIGTATTSILVWLGGSVDFTQYFMILAFVGAMAYLLVKEEKKSNIAMLVFSVGALFLGLKVLGSGMKAIASTDVFVSIVKAVAISPWSALVTSIGLTGLMQSSSATVTIVQNVFDASSDVMGTSSAIAMVIGANIGTTFTALITSIGSNKDSKRIALIWLITNLTMAAFMMPFIHYYSDMIELMSGKKMLELAFAHIIFNSVMVFIFIWVVKPLEKISKWIIKDAEIDSIYNVQLPQELIYNSEDMAYQAAKKATIELALMSEDSLKQIYKYLDKKDEKYYKQFKKTYETISIARSNVYAYLVKMGSRNLSPKVSNKHMSLILVVRTIERLPELAHRLAHNLNKSATKIKTKDDSKTKEIKLKEKAKTKEFKLNNKKVKDSKKTKVKPEEKSKLIKFQIDDNDIDNLKELLLLNIALCQKTKKQIKSVYKKRALEMVELKEQIELKILKNKQRHIKSKDYIKNEYDFLDAAKVMVSLSNRLIEIGRYMRKGSKEVHVKELHLKLKNNLERELAKK